MSRLPLVLALLTLPLPLWAADCPVAADLEAKGIAFGAETGEVEEFRQRRPGLIESRYYLSADRSTYSQVVLAKGLYLLELTEVESGSPTPGTRSTYGFPVAPATLPVPDATTPAGTSWTWTLAYNHSGDMGQETHVYTVEPRQQLTFGACSYEVIPVEVRYLPTEGAAEDIDTLHYLPALGLSYLARTTYSGGGETYEYKSIRTLE